MTPRFSAQRRGRRGMILPVVLVAMLLVLTMSASLQQIAWRSLRGAVTQWNAQRGLYAADADVAHALHAFSPESLAATPVGAALALTRVDAEGWRTQVSVIRTAPFSVVVRASSALDHATNPTAASGGLGDATRIHREVWRAARLEPPPLPVLAAATVLGPSEWTGAQLDGRDLPPPRDVAGDDCGPQRDTASVSALVSSLASASAPVATGAIRVLDAAQTARAIAAFDEAWPTILVRAHRLTSDSAGTISTPSPWRAHVISGAHTVTVGSTSQVRGLLLIDGDLIVDGALHVDGALVVRGAVTATNGSLRITGAMVIRDPLAHGSSFGANASVTYAPCLAGRALTAVSRLKIGPNGGWNSP